MRSPATWPTAIALMAVVGLTSALGVGCGGGGPCGGGGGGDWYYHWNCNGDPQCLSLNSACGSGPSGTCPPTGSADEGPSKASCTQLVDFGNHFYGPSATQSCDQSPTGTGTTCGGDGGVVTYTVTYDGNGATGGSVPTDPAQYTTGQTFTVLGNTGNLVKTGFTFSAWNSQANGSGKTWNPGQTIGMSTFNATLYALWVANPTFTVTYDGNGNTGGTVPAPPTAYAEGVTVTVLANTGNLVRSAYAFSGWYTTSASYAPAQTFTMGAADVTLQASWTSSAPRLGFAYVTNSTSNDVSQYVMGIDGALAPMIPATVAAGSTPVSVAVDAVGRHAYVGNSSGSVSQYAIGANGALTALTPASVTDGTPSCVTVAPSGAFAYVTNLNASTVSEYAIGGTGPLTPLAAVAVTAGTEPWALTVDPSGRYAYVANYTTSYVSQFAIGADGSLTAMNPATVPSDAYPTSVAIDPAGKYAYVAAALGNSVSQYAIGVNGALTAMTTPSVGAGSFPYAVAVDPSGKFVYAADEGSNAISQYSIDPSGALSPMTPATVQAGTGPGSISIESSGKFVYVANRNDNTVSQYAINADGGLAPLPIAKVNAGALPTSIATLHSP